VGRPRKIRHELIQTTEKRVAAPEENSEELREGEGVVHRCRGGARKKSLQSSNCDWGKTVDKSSRFKYS